MSDEPKAAEPRKRIDRVGEFGGIAVFVDENCAPGAVMVLDAEGAVMGAILDGYQVHIGPRP
jgi:hypothetical protein